MVCFSSTSCILTVVSAVQGRETEAESEWEYACNNITVGCAKYQDEDWLRRIRRHAAQKLTILVAVQANHGCSLCAAWELLVVPLQCRHLLSLPKPA